MNETGIKSLVAMIGITLLAALALSLGYDGVLFLTVVGILSGLGGYPILQGVMSKVQGFKL